MNVPSTNRPAPRRAKADGKELNPDRSSKPKTPLESAGTQGSGGSQGTMPLQSTSAVSIASQPRSAPAPRSEAGVAHRLTAATDGDGGASHPPGQRTDEQLLSDYREGDKAAFAQLVERYERELFHFLVRFLGDLAAAEDVFQEAFLQVHQSADQFDPQRRFRPWLFTIAANKARDLMRSQARRPTSPLQASISAGDDDSGQFIDLMQSAVEMPGEPMERQELQQQVHKTVMGMPEHLREILLLSYFHQFPYKQISDILSIPLGTVKSRLHAAVAHFADRWRAMNQRHLLS